MINKKFYITIALLSWGLVLNSQLLTVAQTIEYINKLSLDNPHGPYWHFDNETTGCRFKDYDQFQLDTFGNVTITSIKQTFNCKNASLNHGYKKVGTIKFNIEDVNLSNNQILEIRSDKERISITDDLKNEDELYKTFKSRVIQMHFSEDEVRDRCFNAFSYLFSKAKELGYRKQSSNDPFSDPNYGQVEVGASGQAFIPLTNANGVYNVKVNFNNIIASFVLDTGAGDCSISSELEQELIRKGIIKQSDYLKSGLYQLANGSIITCKRVRISKMKVGQLTVHIVVASVGQSGSPNLLGQSFLGKLKHWKLDNTRKALIVN